MDLLRRPGGFGLAKRRTRAGRAGRVSPPGRITLRTDPGRRQPAGAVGVGRVQAVAQSRALGRRGGGLGTDLLVALVGDDRDLRIGGLGAGSGGEAEREQGKSETVHGGLLKTVHPRARFIADLG